MSKGGGSEWMGISDMMSVLMMVFLLISIAFMIDAQKDALKFKQEVGQYFDAHSMIYSKLDSAFKDDLVSWGAELDSSNLTIHFTGANFSTGNKQPKAVFKKSLQEFFPRYLNVLRKPGVEEWIEEVCLEGHTDPRQAFIDNMELSQDRALSVLKIIRSPLDEAELKWTEDVMTTTGYSESRPIEYNGKVLYSKSRRVDFRVVTALDSVIAAMKSSL